MTDVIDMEAATDEMHGMVLSMLPPDLLDLSDIDAARARVSGLLAAMEQPPMPDNVTVSEANIAGFDGAPDVRVKFYRPDGMAEGSPAMVWIHGGGMVLMDADDDDLACAFRAAHHGCLVASVDYRLAPETPAPGAIHDCYAAFRHVVDSADELGIDAARVVIGGASAGGGLAAGTTIFARDQDGPMPSSQLLVFPMLDHRNTTPSSHAIVDHRVWNRSANLAAWEAYLGGNEASAYSSPAICDDLSGLPPAYISVGTLDMFMDEDVEYATALNRAGVPCELRVYPGAFHGSQGFVPDHPVSQRWNADETAFVERALAGQP